MFRVCARRCAVAARCGAVKRAAQGPVGQQARQQGAFVFGAELAIRPGLAEHGKHQRRRGAVHLRRHGAPGAKQVFEPGRLASPHLHHFHQRVAAQRRRAVIDQQTDQAGHALLQLREQGLLVRREAVERIKRFPQAGNALPLRMRIHQLPHRATELDADPRHRVRVVGGHPEHERARQADHADQPHGRHHADPRQRPEIGDDLGNPALPQLPRTGGATAIALHRLQQRAQRIDQVEQRRALVPDLVDQRRGDAAADHALARHADDGDRIVAAARQAGAGTADRRTRPTVEVADDRRRLVVAARQGQRVGRHHVQPGQPDPAVVLAALGDDVVKQVKLGQGGIELHAHESEAALPLGSGGTVAQRATQPAQKIDQHGAQFAPPQHQVALDGRLRCRQQGGGGQHRLAQGERFDAPEPGQQGARLLRQHPRGIGAHRHDRQMPYKIILRP